MSKRKRKKPKQKQHAAIGPVICNHCDQPAKLVTGAVIYPHRRDLSRLKIYHCKPCGAYVGCHKGTEIPKGTLATAEQRHARIRAHAAFDPIWQDGYLSRGEAYRWLAKVLEVDRVHIGESGVHECKKIESLSRMQYAQLEREGATP